MRAIGLCGRLLLALPFTALVIAQQPARVVPERAEFEVVSIKPADSSAPAHVFQAMPGGFRGQNLRLFELIMSAWHLNRDRIVGGPNWLETAGWDIEARYPAGANQSQQPEMMQAMLADRFRLVTHRETTVQPVYVLSIAKGGLKLAPGDSQGGMSAGPRMIRYGSASMADLASQLSGYVGRQVIDEIQATGRYAIDLRFAPVDPGDAQDPAPSIFQALQDQAGLKLESARRTVEVLVIDRAEKPTPN